MSMQPDSELEKIRRRKIEEMKAMTERQNTERDVQNTPIKVEDDSFDQSVSQHPLIVVDCWAPWCGPCRMVAPVIDELAKAYAGKIVFGKLNVDENPQTAGRFGIMSIPTLLVMKKGKEVDRIVGAVPRQVIETRIRKLID